MIKLIQKYRMAVPFIGVFFLISRLFLVCCFQPSNTDVKLYSHYAFEKSNALRNNVTIYDTNDATIEYPPLAIMWMSAPMLFLNMDDEFGSMSQDTFYKWRTIFKYFCFGFDMFLFCILLILFLDKSSSFKVGLRGLIVYVVTGSLLFYFLYDRLDLYLGGILFLAFLLLRSHKHWMFALSMLAIGINFKLVPILLVPLFIIGTIPANFIGYFYKGLFRKQLVLAVLKRSLFLVGVTFSLFLPFYFWGGSSTLDFLSYHSDRGLQLESIYSSILMMLHYIGLPVSVNFAFGSFNLESELSAFFSVISSLFVVVSVLGILLFCISRLKQHSLQSEAGEVLNKDTKTLAQFFPQTFLYLTIATLLAGIAFSKVFSPQYLLWLVPLFGLLTYQNKSAKWAGVLFVFVCLLTALIYPFLYFTDFVHNQAALADGSVCWEAPTILAATILILRNFLLIATTLMLLNASKSVK